MVRLNGDSRAAILDVADFGVESTVGESRDDDTVGVVLYTECGRGCCCSCTGRAGRSSCCSCTAVAGLQRRGSDNDTVLYETLGADTVILARDTVVRGAWCDVQPGCVRGLKVENESEDKLGGSRGCRGYDTDALTTITGGMRGQFPILPSQSACS